MDLVCFNGKILRGDQPLFTADNKGYRYGDGLFETMKIVNGNICLADYHFERLSRSCEMMGYSYSPFFSMEKIKEHIALLCDKNNCTSLARVRLSVSRGNGGLYEANNEMQYLIECWSIHETVNHLNENGLVIGIYPLARKSCDPFSNMKSANFLPYSMAAHYARQNKWNDCLVLNTNDRIADSTIANIFLITKGKISTPPLSEGCINGVMRRHLIETVTGMDWGSVEEAPVTEEDLLLADEIFLTNAVQGIKWVGQFGDRKYTNTITSQIYRRLVQTIFH